MARAGGDSPSPIMPVVMLAIVGVMVVLPGYLRPDPYTTASLSSIMSSPVLLVLIPILLLLAVQAFWIYQGNEQQPARVAVVQGVRTRFFSPLIDAFRQNARTTEAFQNSQLVETMRRNPAASAVLIGVIIALFILLPIHNYMHSSPPPRQHQAPPGPFHMSKRRYPNRKPSWWSLL